MILGSSEKKEADKNINDKVIVEATGPTVRSAMNKRKDETCEDNKSAEPEKVKLMHGTKYFFYVIFISGGQSRRIIGILR